ncbi:MAG: hypothetical protein V1867_06735 [Candidatus Falkowbacteria bacterium]
MKQIGKIAGGRFLVVRLVFPLFSSPPNPLSDSGEGCRAERGGVGEISEEGGAEAVDNHKFNK